MTVTLSFPGPFRLGLLVGFPLFVLTLQLATGTSLEFAELTFIAVFFSMVAINLAGGLRTLAGCCLAVIALKVFVIAELAKAFYGEPGQSRLQQPVMTMSVEALSMAALALAAFVCLPFRPKRVVLRPVTDVDSLRTIAVVGFLLGTGSFFAAQVIGVNEDGAIPLGGFGGLLRRLSFCSPIAIIAGTAYSVKSSNGTRILSLYNVVPSLLEFGIGVLFTSKQALFEPFFYLLLTGIAFRYRWRASHLFSGIIVALLSFFVLFPFGQVARNYTRGRNLADTWNKTLAFFDENLRNPHYVFDQYADYRESVLNDDDFAHYFKQPNGPLERSAMIKPADCLISAAVKQGKSGCANLLPGLADLLPRAILPHPWFNVGNEMGYKAGFVDEQDFATCVSFGFAADAFDAFGWRGVAVVSFAIGLLLILNTRIITQSLPFNIWALAFFGSWQVAIAEASIGGVLQALLPYWTLAIFCGVRFTAFIWSSLKRGASYGKSGFQSVPNAV